MAKLNWVIYKGINMNEQNKADFLEYIRDILLPDLVEAESMGMAEDVGRLLDIAEGREGINKRADARANST
jgi:hypothetical protein